MSLPRNLYKRITASVPLFVTVVVHVVLIAIAGYFVVSEQIIGKKRIMEAAADKDPSVAQKQVEHRLQVARKGGGSASSSPVSASRIFSTAESALQMPAMPDLPSVGASSLAGAGFGKGVGAVGGGTGYNTSVGNGNGLGAGFMSMSFLGTTSQKVSKVAFIVDVGPDLMDIRKGGFEAFKIIREEIMKLVSRLPPSAEFGVVLYARQGAWNRNSVAALDSKLLPATVANKQQFFDWMTPVNATGDRVGMASVQGRRLRWTPRELPTAGLDDTLNTPEWSQALHFVLEMQPEVVYVISGSKGGVSHDLSEERLAAAKEAHRKNVEKRLEELKRDGIDIKAVEAARGRAYAKVRAEFDAMNAKLKAQGKSPFIITRIERVFEPDFQAAMKKAGFPPIKLDFTGWTDKEGKPIYGFGGVNPNRGADWDELIFHVAKLQRSLSKDRAVVNYFLFVGPNEDPKAAIEDLSKFTSRNGGKFQLLTTKRLQEMSSRDDPKK